MSSKGRFFIQHSRCSKQRLAERAGSMEVGHRASEMPSVESYAEVDCSCMLKQTGDYDVEKDVDG